MNLQLKTWTSNWRHHGSRARDMNLEMETSCESGWKYEPWIGDIMHPELETWTSNWRYHESRGGDMSLELETWISNWRLYAYRGGNKNPARTWDLSLKLETWISIWRHKSNWRHDAPRGGRSSWWIDTCISRDETCIKFTHYYFLNLWEYVA